MVAADGEEEHGHNEGGVEKIGGWGLLPMEEKSSLTNENSCEDFDGLFTTASEKLDHTSCGKAQSKHGAG